MLANLELKGLAKQLLVKYLVREDETDIGAAEQRIRGAEGFPLTEVSTLCYSY